MGQAKPLFSIVVPTYARPRQLERCLYSLTTLDYPCDLFEVIVVDDGSETSLEAMVASFVDQIDIRLLTQPHGGPSAARNRGAAQARGNYLAFTDDDCVLSPSWLLVLAAGFTAAPECAIGGRTLNALASNPFSTTSQLIIDFVYSRYNTDPNQAQFFATNNLAVPTQCFHTVGGFRADIYTFAAAEDRDFCDRWLRHGYQMIYVPEAVIYHAHNLTFRTFWRQHLNYGRGAFRFRRSDTTRSRPNSRLESLAFYLNLLCYPFSRAELHRAPLLILLMVISQMSTLVGFCSERRNQTSQMAET
jgi:GT2 family glycosyltransferase